MMRRPSIRLCVLSFEAVLLQATEQRVSVLLEALATFGIDTSRTALRRHIADTLPGATFAEVVNDLPSDAASDEPHAVTLDATLRDLVVLEAGRRWRALLQGTVTIDPRRLTLLARAVANGWRVILRADSERVDVERVLARTSLDQYFAMVRCSDDPPVSDAPVSGAPLRNRFEHSWAAIRARTARWSTASVHAHVLEVPFLRSRVTFSRPMTMPVELLRSAVEDRA